VRSHCFSTTTPDSRLAVLGDAVNCVSRLQALAAPDSITLGETLHQLLQGAIENSLIG
jgi:class 3 adenylate cyclase